MPELTEADATGLMMEYYGKEFLSYKVEDIENLIVLLNKINIAGLVIYAYARGVLDTRGER